MANVPVQTIGRDPQLFYWILFPITIVMILTGILRHYASVLMATTAKTLDARAMREQRAMVHGVSVRTNFYVLSKQSFESRRDVLAAAYESGEYLKDPDNKGQAANPLTDPSQMDGLKGALVGNMAMIVPNTLIMGWINAYFNGYVIMKLPFPITIKFKSMLQAGVATKDMDARWMSSISWYFLCIFGLQAVFNFLLGSDNAANQLAAQMGQVGPQAPQLMGPGVDPDKQFKIEGENLAVIEHYSILDGIEERLLSGFKSRG